MTKVDLWKNYMFQWIVIVLSVHHTVAFDFLALAAAALAVFLSRFFSPSRLVLRRVAYACNV